MHADKDKTNGHVSYREYIDINVAVSHLANEGVSTKYTVYKVTLKTNSISFSCPFSQVQRRYSDFLWLRRSLQKICSISARVPDLPKRQLAVWNFKESFLEERRIHLERFLRRVVKETVFLSCSALHLFLQTELSPALMDECIMTGKANEAISKHFQVGSVSASVNNNSLLNSCESAIGSSSEHAESEAEDEDSNLTNVLWKVEVNTMRRITSLPQFSSFESYGNLRRSASQEKTE